MSELYKTISDERDEITQDLFDRRLSQLITEACEAEITFEHIYTQLKIEAAVLREQERVLYEEIDREGWVMHKPGRLDEEVSR
jgi:hypothetical protein